VWFLNKGHRITMGKL